jgi:hypothetical protein
MREGESAGMYECWKPWLGQGRAPVNGADRIKYWGEENVFWKVFSSSRLLQLHLKHNMIHLSNTGQSCLQASLSNPAVQLQLHLKHNMMHLNNTGQS